MSDRSGIITTLRAAGCVFAEEEADLLLASGAGPVELSTMVERRVAGLPLEQVLGWVDFCGQRITIEPGVFVPRRRTALLVRQAARLCPPRSTIVDIACGSGAVAVALAALVHPIAIYAVDLETAAVHCARLNLEPLGAQVFHGNLYRPLPDSIRGRINIITANVPYVPTDAVALMPPEARLHEPRIALDGGPDGLHVMRRVAAEAAGWLAPGGHVLVETSDAQAPAACEAMAEGGLHPRVVRRPDRGATVVIGRR